MAATFIALSKDDVFKSGGTADHLVKIPEVDNIVGTSGLALYTEVSMQISETIQYFLTFDDVIKFIHFGKGLGTIAVQGIMFSDCSGDLPGLPKFSAAISALRGKEQDITIGDIGLTAIMTSAQVNLTGEPDTMGQFVFNFSIVNHQL